MVVEGVAVDGVGMVVEGCGCGCRWCGCGCGGVASGHLVMLAQLNIIFRVATT